MLKKKHQKHENKAGVAGDQKDAGAIVLCTVEAASKDLGHVQQ
jgi:hypothetical protein